jgi:hypothetical protein
MNALETGFRGKCRSRPEGDVWSSFEVLRLLANGSNSSLAYGGSMTRIGFLFLASAGSPTLSTRQINTGEGASFERIRLTGPDRPVIPIGLNLQRSRQ